MLLLKNKGEDSFHHVMQGSTKWTLLQSFPVVKFVLSFQKFNLNINNKHKVYSFLKKFHTYKINKNILKSDNMKY